MSLVLSIHHFRGLPMVACDVRVEFCFIVLVAECRVVINIIPEYMDRRCTEHCSVLTDSVLELRVVHLISVGFSMVRQLFKYTCACRHKDKKQQKKDEVCRKFTPIITWQGGKNFSWRSESDVTCTG